MNILEYHSGYICVKILGKFFSIPCGQEFYSSILVIRRGIFIPHPIARQKAVFISWL